MAEDWTVDNAGWMDHKANAADPDWWYEMRWVNPQTGEAYGPEWLVFGCRRQYRKQSAEWIIAETQRRQRLEGEAMMRHMLLPVYATAFRCMKCGHQEAKDRFDPATESERGRIVRTCRGCKAVSSWRPLDWEDPT